ncbi:MAG: hypothetical protein V4760_16970 [Bdellovibrionota bacterium]
MNRVALSFIIAFGLALGGCTSTAQRPNGIPYRKPCSSYDPILPAFNGASGDAAYGILVIYMIAALASSGSHYDPSSGRKCLD